MDPDRTSHSRTISAHTSPSTFPTLNTSPVKHCANPCICSACGATFLTVVGFHRHQAMHDKHPSDLRRVDNVITQCSICDRHFTTSRALVMHHRRTHPNNYRVFMESRKAKQSVTWSKEEDSSLLRLADELSQNHLTLRDLFAALHRRIPMRSAAAIRKRLQFLKWKRPKNSYVVQQAEQNNPAAQPFTKIVTPCSDSSPHSDGPDTPYHPSLSFSTSSLKKQPRMGAYERPAAQVTACFPVSPAPSGGASGPAGNCNHTSIGTASAAAHSSLRNRVTESPTPRTQGNDSHVVKLHSSTPSRISEKDGNSISQPPMTKTTSNLTPASHPCDLCPKSFRTLGGLRRHLAVHRRNPTGISTSVSGHVTHDFRCTICCRSFTTKTGLSQHNRHRHPAHYNSTCLARIPAHAFNWSKLEDERLEKAASELRPSCCSFPALLNGLSTLFPHRTTGSLRKRLQYLQWCFVPPASSSSGVIYSECPEPVSHKGTPSAPNQPPGHETPPPSHTKPFQDYLDLVPVNHCASACDSGFNNKSMSPPTYSSAMREADGSFVTDSTPMIVCAEVFVPSPRMGPVEDTISGTPEATPDMETYSLFRRLLSNALEMILRCTTQGIDRHTHLRNLLSLFPPDGSRESFSEQFNAICANMFPHKWQPTKRRRKTQVVANNRQRRRLQYGHVQRLYHTRRKDAAATVIDGRWRTAYIPEDARIPGFTEFWSSILSQPMATDYRPPRDILPPNTELVKPITVMEMQAVLRKMQGTAPGVDRITPAAVTRMDPNFVTCFLNCLLASYPFPSHMNVARVTFVPKVQLPLAPEHFRPISVTSVFTRMLHRILFDRWVPYFPSDRLQFGFLRKDGCFEAPSILHAALRYAHSSRKPLSLASLDISKAFDSVAHHSLLRAASAFGAPSMLLEYLASYYTSAISTFNSVLLHPQRGVRQGDPLSPLLFLMTLDEALQGLTTKPWISPAGPIDYLAYADDVIIFAEDRSALEDRVTRFSERLCSMGLSINDIKSVALNIVVDRTHKMTVLDTMPLTTGNSCIQSVQPDGKFTVLGLPFSWRGKLSPPCHVELRRQLEEVTKAPLKPYQRLDILKTFLIPRHIHQLSLSVIHRKTLKGMDRTVRVHVRKWLRMPKDASKSYLHAKIDDFGLGIPCLTTSIPLMRKTRLERHLNNSHPITAWAIRDPAASTVHRLATGPVMVGSQPVMDKSEAAAAWKQSLLNTADGAPLKEAFTTPDAHQWLREPSRVFPRLFIRAIHLRGGLLSTKIRRARGRTPEEPTSLNCRGNCGQKESLSHVLQFCQVTHDARCKRHNSITQLVVKKLRARQTRLILEPRVPTPASFIKPDIIVVKDSSAYVMDVAICDTNRMFQSYQLKLNKYATGTHATAIDHYVRAQFPGVREVVHRPIVINNRGMIFPRSAKQLKGLGFTRFDISDLCLATLRWTLMVYDVYMRGASFQAT